tara:strand:- start:842 stop:1207 length:366 start_codon:yes stop_codon:yes gene_type:complete
MAAVTPLSDGLNLGGEAVCILENGDSIDISALAGAGGSEKVKIVSMHWTTDSTGMVVTYGDTTANNDNTLQLYGGGTWSRYNGFDGILSDADISVAGNGTIIITVKKIEGYAHRSDYKATE